MGSRKTELTQPWRAEALRVDVLADELQLVMQLLTIDYLPAIEKLENSAVVVEGPFLAMTPHGFSFGADTPEVKVVIHCVAGGSHGSVVWSLQTDHPGISTYEAERIKSWPFIRFSPWWMKNEEALRGCYWRCSLRALRDQRLFMALMMTSKVISDSSDAMKPCITG